MSSSEVWCKKPSCGETDTTVCPSGSTPTTRSVTDVDFLPRVPLARLHRPSAAVTQVVAPEAPVQLPVAPPLAIPQLTDPVAAYVTPGQDEPGEGTRIQLTFRAPHKVNGGGMNEIPLPHPASSKRRS